MRTHNRYLILVAALFAFGCKSHTPTPAQTELFVLKLQAQGGESREFILDATLGAGNPTELQFAVTTATVPSGGRVITKVRGTVADGGGWAVTQTGQGKAINKGTTAAPIVAVPITIQRYRVAGLTEELRTHIVEVRSDGTLSIE